MRRFAVIAIAAASMLFAACTPNVTVENTEADGASASGIAVSGTGEVYGTPDTLQMRFGVSVLRPTVEQAVGDAAALADELISSLGSAGVAPPRPSGGGVAGVVTSRCLRLRPYAP